MDEQVSTAGSQNTEGTQGSGSVSQIPYSRFSEVVGQKNTLETQLKEATARLQALEEQKLLQEKDWQALAEKRQQEAAEALRVAETSKLELLRYQVGAAQGVPAPLIERLRGNTVEELTADAKTILTLIPKPQAPATDAGQPKNPETHSRMLTPKEVEVYNAFALHIPDLTPEEYAKTIDGG